MKFIENYSLKQLNTFGIDVCARFFSEVASVNDVLEILDNKQFKSTQKFILGGGSNILFTRNFNGLVIKNNLKGIERVSEDENFYYIKAAAGENWHRFVLHCIKNNYAGTENLSLIPGNVGASPMQNIGAYGVEIKEIFHELEAINIADKKIEKFSNADCKFGYRNSIFKHEVKGEYIIISVTYRLLKKPVFNTSYGAITKELESMGVKELSLAAISEAVCNIRKSKLPDPAVIGNAGSFFKNPEVPLQTFDSLKKDYPEMVAYPIDDHRIKLGAGWLIEQCGWKGKTIGEAGVHKNQALVLVNCGKATGNEIYDLSEKILKSVNEKFGVQLEREVNIV